jgi:hypothetical protein
MSDRPQAPSSAPRDAWISEKLEVRESPVHGMGTFTVTDAKAGEVLEVWGEFREGRRTVEYTNDEDKLRRARDESKAVMQWDDDLYSIEEPGDDPGYFTNHSCDGRLWFRDTHTLVARRTMRAGEEATVDDALFEADPTFVAAWQCACGSPGCRRVITGRDWEDPAVQRRYEGHFIPLLNKRIAKRS